MVKIALQSKLIHSSKELVKSIKEREKAEKKSNVTFRVNNTLMDALRNKCEQEDISMNKVIEMLIKEFVEG